MKKPETKRSWDLLPKDVREESIRQIIHHFEVERGDSIGVIAAEQFLDFTLHLIGGEIYKKGIKDSQSVLRQRFEDLDVDLELLIQG